MTLPVRLGMWPTPLEPAPRLAVALGLEPDDLWIKRDDLTGLGGGGNKVRKLQYTCAEALAAGATTLVTTGAPQSNHARLTAAAGVRLGLRVVLVLGGSAPAAPVGNLLLDGLLGAEIRWAGDADLAAVAEDVVSSLDSAFVIPFGGSSVVGARGYADCAHELLSQAFDLDQVVVAVGSGGTMAGLVSVLGADRVIGVHTGAVADPYAVVSDLVDGLGLGRPALRILMDQVGAGYSTLTPEVTDALRLAARSEGLILDPVYTGRALAGLRSLVASGDVRPGQRTVFLHSGGLPGLFGHPSGSSLAV